MFRITGPGVDVDEQSERAIRIPAPVHPFLMSRDAADLSSATDNIQM